MINDVSQKKNKTQNSIQIAFINLLKEKPFTAITVKDISEGALINRKTFYSYYENKEILYDEITTEIFDALCSSIIYKKDEPSEVLCYDTFHDDILKFLSILTENQEDFRAILHPSLHPYWFPILESTIVTKKSSLFLKINKDEKESDIPFKLYIDTISTLFVVWIYWWLSQEDYSVSEGTDFLCRMMNKNMTSVFRYVKPPKN